MKILQVSPFLGEQFGGTERFCSNLSQQLVKAGHEVHVFTARINPQSQKEENLNGVKIFRFTTPKVVWGINPFAFMLHKLFTAKYDIIHVHSHLYFSSIQAILAKIFRSPFSAYPPIVLHLHGGLGLPSSRVISRERRVIKWWFDKSLGSLFIHAANKILAQSHAFAKSAIDQFPRSKPKMDVVLNAIDTSQFGNPDFSAESNGRLLFVGDLENWKGVSILIDAMRLLKQQGEDIGLTIVGVGRLASLLKIQADGLDVKFLGQQPHDAIPYLMARSYAFVLPSLWEGIPTVGLEAMAAGVPFIGTSVGGIPEIITHKKTGLLVEPDSPGALADAILALKDKELRHRLQERAYELVTTKHDITDAAKKIETIYRNLIT